MVESLQSVGRQVASEKRKIKKKGLREGKVVEGREPRMSINAPGPGAA